ncbi:MAG: hypothetical protein PHS57_04965 [Alphaproteobacteria bacterium]|nr:hypothetical protein [Alphaproteobacteria bacterium]
MTKPEIRRILKNTHVLTGVDDRLLVAKGRALYLYDDRLDKGRLLNELPMTSAKKALSFLRLGRRLLRLDPTMALPLGTGQALILAGSDVWRIDVRSGALEHEISFAPHKALNLTRVEGLAGIPDGFYAGAYAYNPQRDPMPIWYRPLHEPDWQKIYTFPKGTCDHIHNVVADPYRNCLWVLTGDYDRGAALWQVRDRFASVHPVVSGNQIYRAVWLVPYEDGLLYATDSNIDPNALLFLKEKDGWTLERLSALPGSSIYAQRWGEGVLFSTTVEPGAPSGRFLYDILDNRRGGGIADASAHLFFYTRDEGLREILRVPKDAWPMRLFQFGAFQFAQHPTPQKIYAYGIGLRGYDDATIELQNT